MSVKKYLSFKSPYLYSTFNKVTEMITGINGVLFGMDVVEDGSDVIISKGAFVLNGMIMELQDNLIATPTTGIVPLYLVASTSSALEEDPVVFSFTSELSDYREDAAALISKYNGKEWVSPEKIALNSIIREGHSHNKYVAGKGVYSGYDASINDAFDTISLPEGYLLDGVGTKYETTKPIDFGVGDLDPDFPRRDVVVYRRPIDDWRKPGIIEKVVGPTYSLNEFSRFENVKENQVSTPIPSAVHEKPRCIVDADNNLHIFWLVGTNLYYAKWAADRTSQIIAPTLNEVGVEEFDVVLDKDNKINITALISGNIIYKRITITGTVDVSARVVSSQPNEVSNPTITVDRLGYVYIMYSHVEQISGVPNFNRQIYFTQLNPSGTTAILPNKVTLDTKDYITPKIQIDEDRIIHLAAEDDGQDRIYYGTFTHLGEIRTSMVDISDDTGGNFGTGEYTSFGISACDSPVIQLSDVGDVYVAWTQLRSHPSFVAKSVILYHPSFKEVSSWKALALGMDNRNLGFGEHGYGVRGYGRDLVDRVGVVLADEDMRNPSITIDGYRNVIISADGRLDPTDAHSVWAVKMANNAFGRGRRLVQLGPFQLKHTFDYADTFEAADIQIDKTGCITAVWTDTENIFFNKSTASVFIEGFVESDVELWLSEISLPHDTISKLDDVSVTNREKNTVAERINKVTVGVNESSGDFVGDHGIKQAIEYLKGFGGVIEVQSGTYLVGNSYELFSGIKIKTIGEVYFEKAGGIGPIFTMTGKKAAIDSKTSYSFTDLDIDFRAQGFLLGDIVDLLDSSGNFLQRTRIVGINGTGGVGGRINITIHTKDEVSTYAAQYIVYRCGTGIENASLLGNNAGNNIEMIYAAKSNISEVTSNGAFENGIHIQHSLDCIIQHCVCNDNNGRGIRVDSSRQGNVYVVNNVCSNNSADSDHIDIEFTASTQNNFVWANKAILKDDGINNQPSQEQVHSMSPAAFGDFVEPAKVKHPDANSGDSANPYGYALDKDGSAREGLYYLPIEKIEYDHDGNFFIGDKGRKLIISVNGNWKIKTDNLTGKKSIVSISKNAHISATYYGTAILMVAKIGTAQSSDITSVIDGISTSISLATGRGGLDDTFSVVPLYSGQSKEIHNVQLTKNDASGSGYFEIRGFYVNLSSETSDAIHVNEGYAFIEGLRYKHTAAPDLAIPSATGLGRTDCISAGVDGAYRVDKGIDIIIGDTTALSGVDMTRPKEEVSVSEYSLRPEIYSVDEFDFFKDEGVDFTKGHHADPSIMLWGTIGGVYSGAKKDVLNFEDPAIRLESAGDELHMIVKCTGLSLNLGVLPGIHDEAIEVRVDGDHYGEFTAPMTSENMEQVEIPIFSNGIDCSHYIILKSKASNLQPCLYMQGFTLYRGKRPSIAPYRTRIATFRNFTSTLNTYIDKCLDDNFNPIGASWDDLGYDDERINGAGYVVNGGLGDYFEIYFYGVGIRLFYKGDGNSSEASVLIDGNTPSSLGASGNNIISSGGSDSNTVAEWYDLTPGYHTLKITPTELGKTFKPNAYGVKPVRAFAIQQNRKVSPVENDILLIK